jgi:CheY-like chemotaxis protein
VEDKKLNILILDDDETIGLALKETLERAGHIVFLSADPESASENIKMNQIDFLFCDCLLPQMTGLDFIEQIGEKIPNARFKIVLMSGIYTDKSFVQEALKKTQAYAFLIKPFELSEVLDLIAIEEEKNNVSNEAEVRKSLYQIFTNQGTSSSQKKKIIEAIDQVSGFDLPFILHLIVETKSSGFLNIYNLNGSISVIALSHGRIVGVDIGDGKSLVGEMLIQNGYCNAQDIQSALVEKKKRRLGSFLIENNQLSPHAFDLILKEQMNLRLLNRIIEEKVSINFAASDVEMLNPSIGSDDLLFFMHDWIASKISMNWLKSFFMIWSENTIIKTLNFTEDNAALDMPLVKGLEGLSLRLDKKVNLNQILDVAGYNEITVYKGLYFMLIKGLIIFAPKAIFTTTGEQLNALNKLWNNLDGKNEFQIFTYLDKCGFTTNNLDILMNSFYELIGNEPHPSDKLVHSLWHKIKSTVEEAVAMSLDSTKIDRYREEFARNDSEAKIQAGNLMEEVKKTLHLNQFSLATSKLLEVAKLNPQAHQFHIYNSWTKLGMPIDPTKKGSILREIELELLQVPADEKYDALFSFVNGLFSKNKGDLVVARKFFEKSIGLDSTFMPARREISILEATSKKQDVFNMDIKDMLTGMFKKK